METGLPLWGAGEPSPELLDTIAAYFAWRQKERARATRERERKQGRR